MQMFCLTASYHKMNDRAIICWLLCHPLTVHPQNKDTPVSVSQHWDIPQSMKTIKNISIWRHNSCKGTRNKRLATLESSAVAVWRCSLSMGQRMRSWCTAFPLWLADPHGSVSVAQDASASSQAVCLWHCSCNGWTCNHLPETRGHHLIHTSLILFDEQYKLRTSLYNFPAYCHFYLGPEYSPQHPVLDTPLI